MNFINILTAIYFIINSSINGLYLNNNNNINDANHTNVTLDCSNENDRLFRMEPNGIIIGVKKSGTYALLRYLSINPHVRSALKINDCLLNEIHYFDNDSNYELGIEWYKSQMPYVCKNNNDDRIDLSKIRVIEKTPGYFRNEKVPERVYKLNPNMKIILIVRDPVKRLQSELTHCDTRQKKYNLDRKCFHLNTYFETLFRNNSTSIINNELKQNRFIRNSIYYLDMLKWFKYFNRTNIFVINGENFIKSPWIELNKLENFLNIDNFIQRKHFRFVKNKNFYCINELKSTNRTAIINGCLGKNKGRKNHVYLSDYVKNELKMFFKPWNQLFFKLIGTNLNW